MYVDKGVHEHDIGAAVRSFMGLCGIYSLEHGMGLAKGEAE